MDEQTERPDQPTAETRVGMRFEATVHPAEPGVMALEEVGPRVADLDLDRVPDPEDAVRVVVDVAELTRLLEQGFEVRLQRAVPVHPLDPSLVASDADVQAWLDEAVRATPRTDAD